MSGVRLPEYRPEYGYEVPKWGDRERIVGQSSPKVKRLTKHELKTLHLVMQPLGYNDRCAVLNIAGKYGLQSGLDYAEAIVQRLRLRAIGMRRFEE